MTTSACQALRNPLPLQTDHTGCSRTVRYGATSAPTVQNRARIGIAVGQHEPRAVGGEGGGRVGAGVLHNCRAGNTTADTCHAVACVPMRTPWLACVFGVDRTIQYDLDVSHPKNNTKNMAPADMLVFWGVERVFLG
eukprot:gene17789-biopygen2358